MFQSCLRRVQIYTRNGKRSTKDLQNITSNQLYYYFEELKERLICDLNETLSVTGNRF